MGGVILGHDKTRVANDEVREFGSLRKWDNAPRKVYETRSRERLSRILERKWGKWGEGVTVLLQTWARYPDSLLLCSCL